MCAAEHKYDESKIKTLSSLEHIRKRTGMYIGRIGDGTDYDDGIYVLVKEVVDNGIDEFIMGFGKKIEVTVEDGMVTVRDFGRGSSRVLREATPDFDGHFGVIRHGCGAGASRAGLAEEPVGARAAEGEGQC